MFQVPDAASPIFTLHIQPGQPEARNNTFAQAISHAGHGMGLQVFPGSIDEFVDVSRLLFCIMLGRVVDIYLGANKLHVEY